MRSRTFPSVPHGSLAFRSVPNRSQSFRTVPFRSVSFREVRLAPVPPDALTVRDAGRIVYNRRNRLGVRDRPAEGTRE
jgi:hypothetical protein